MSLAARRPRVYVIVLGCLFAVVSLGASAYFLHDRPSSAAVEPFFSGLGTNSRKVTTSSPLAQRYFNQGLAFLYGFNQTEAARSFEAAAACDPQCAMAFWGIAIANGELVNDPSADEQFAKAAVQAIGRADRLKDNATLVDRALIDALATRYTDPMPADPKPLDRAYASAMQKVWENYPDDGDVGALTGESLMMLHRQGLWTEEGEAQSGAEKIIQTFETVLSKHPMHPYALHLLIHSLEASPHPERGDVAADRLRGLAPGLGHLCHMPTHIDIRRGRWQEAVVASEMAVAADEAYRGIADAPSPSGRMLMAHDNHMLAYAAAMQGESQKATQAIQNLLSELPADFIEQHPAKLDAFFAMPYELHLRFGRWAAMLAEPPPKSSFPIAVAFWHFARGTAFAAKKEIPAAKAELREFQVACRSVPEGAIFRKNSGAVVLSIAERILGGEILYREGKTDQAVAMLRDAVGREDSLLYVEPPEWILPARHVLGATLMDAGRFTQAEAVYREDLARRPENGWSLYGLSRSLRAQKKAVEAAAVAARLKQAWQYADVKLTASCLCLPSKD